MKLSDLHIGDVFYEVLSEKFFVIIDVTTLLIGAIKPSNVIFYVKNYYLNTIGDPNQNRPFEFTIPLDNFYDNTVPTTYPLSEQGIVSIPYEELPLLVNVTDKTVWFEKVLNKDIENYGQNIYTMMKDALKEKGLLNGGK